MDVWRRLFRKSKIGVLEAVSVVHTFLKWKETVLNRERSFSKTVSMVFRWCMSSGVRSVLVIQMAEKCMIVLISESV